MISSSQRLLPAPLHPAGQQQRNNGKGAEQKEADEVAHDGRRHAAIDGAEFPFALRTRIDETGVRFLDRLASPASELLTNTFMPTGGQIMPRVHVMTCRLHILARRFPADTVADYRYLRGKTYGSVGKRCLGCRRGASRDDRPTGGRSGRKIQRYSASHGANFRAVIATLA